jgi:pimeloyl-ACP methyl ester carboxylesterase
VSEDLLIPVDGGELTVQQYGPEDAASTVLAVHGITASSRSWAAVASQLPEVRVLAPDLRGRGRSNGLPGPYGLRQHAADLVRVVQHLGVQRPVVVGHSMGGFVSVLFGASHDTAALLLIDGGFPLERPAGVTPEQLEAVLLGPAAARLSQEFPDREAYLSFWRQHPALASDWGPLVEAYADYDLQGTAPHLRVSALIDAVGADMPEQFGPEWYLDAMRSLRVPVAALHAPRGLLDDAPLYAPGRMEQFRAEIPQLRVVEVDDVNHYTIVMAERGASAIAAEVRAALV